VAAFDPARPKPPVGHCRSRPGGGPPALFVKRMRREIGYLRDRSSKDLEGERIARSLRRCRHELGREFVATDTRC
jgi:hypothetical protein